MTDHTLPLIASSKHHRTFGQRVVLWIETQQQRKADREIARVLGRARN